MNVSSASRSSQPAILPTVSSAESCTHAPDTSSSPPSDSVVVQAPLRETNAIELACERGDLVGLQLLVEDRSNRLTYEELSPALVCVVRHDYATSMALLTCLHASIHNSRSGSETEAMKEAARLGSVDAMEWFRVNVDLVWDIRFAEYAARAGHLDAVQWISTNSHKELYLPEVIMQAARGGHLAVVEWAHNGRDRGDIEWCDQDYAQDAAIEGGNLEILEYFRNRGYSFPCCSANFKLDAYPMDWAVAHGHFHVVKWLINTAGCRHTNGEAFLYSVESNHAELVQLMVDHVSVGSHIYTVFKNAAELGHLETINILLSVDPEECSYQRGLEVAALNGHMEVVQAIFEAMRAGSECEEATSRSDSDSKSDDESDDEHSEHSIQPYAQAMINALENSHIGIAEWLHNSLLRCCRDQQTIDGNVALFAEIYRCSHPKARGDPEVTEWLRQNLRKYLDLQMH